MIRVIIESPYSGDVKANETYARACVKDSLLRGEAPIASHLLHTQKGILNDKDPEERELGMRAGHAWYSRGASKCVVYCDRGVSKGMAAGIVVANTCGVDLEFRWIEE